MEPLQPVFDDRGLVPAIAQDARTGAVLMLAYMDQEAYDRTLETGFAHYHSRSRDTLWKKGETSGHTQRVLSVRLDCDRDAVVLLVDQTGPACHTGAPSCFFNQVGEDSAPPNSAYLYTLAQIIQDRKKHPKEGSYTNYLFEKGLDKILKKIGEESTETVIAAKNPGTEELCCESADLLYHLLVLLNEKELPLDDVLAELAKRHRPDEAPEEPD